MVKLTGVVDAPPAVERQAAPVVAPVDAKAAAAAAAAAKRLADAKAKTLAALGRGNAYHCPIPTLKHWRVHAKPLTVVVDGKPFATMQPKLDGNGNGNLSWSYSDKVDVDVGGITARAQVSFSITLIHSNVVPE